MKYKKTAIYSSTGQDGAYLSHFLLQKGYKVIGTTRNRSNKNLHRLERPNIKNYFINGSSTKFKVL